MNQPEHFLSVTRDNGPQKVLCDVLRAGGLLSQRQRKERDKHGDNRDGPTQRTVVNCWSGSMRMGIVRGWLVRPVVK